MTSPREMKLIILQFITVIVNVGGNRVIPKSDKIEPVVVLQDLTNGHNVVGEKMELECQTTFYAKYVSIEWKTPRDDVYKNVNLREKTDSSYVTTSTLVVNKAGIQHSGLYICEIIHKQLNYKLATRKISITIYGKEEHIIRVNSNFQINARAEIEIKIKAHPQISVQWINSRQEILKNSSETTISLTQTHGGEYNYKAKVAFNHVTFNDLGLYTIIVENGIEKLKKSVEIYLPEKINVDLSLSSANEEDMTAVYECRALGILKPNVTWMFQPCDILRCLDYDEPFTEKEIVVKDFHYEDRGLEVVSYVSMNLTDVGILRCVTQHSEAKEIVFHTHQFEYFDKRLEVEYRQIVNILYSRSLYKYTDNVFWYHNDKIINKQKLPYFKIVTHTFSDTALDQLSFDFVMEDQLGNFTYQSFRRTGEAESKTIEVVSKNMSSLVSKISLKDLNGGHTTVGQDIRLVCNVTSYRHERIDWWFDPTKHKKSKNKDFGDKLEILIDNQKISKKVVQTVVDSNIYITTNYLTILQANKSENGYYGCGLVHNELSHYNDFIWVQIYDVNETSLSFEEKIQFDEANMNIKVLLIAHPSPVIKWFDNHGKEIVSRDPKPSNLFLSSKQILDRRENDANYEVILTFNRIDVEHFGNYTIVAENEYGKISHSIEVNVTGGPSTPKIDIYNISTKNVTLKCSSAGYPRPTIEWYFEKCPTLKCLSNYQPQHQNKRLPLTELWNKNNGLQCISYISVNLSERGLFVCQSSNAFGETYRYQPVLGSDTGVEMYIGTKNYSNYSNKSIELIGETNLELICAASKFKYMNKFTPSIISYEVLNNHQLKVASQPGFRRNSELNFIHFDRVPITVKSPSNNFYSCNFLENGFLNSRTFHVESQLTAYVSISNTNLAKNSVEVDEIGKSTFYCYFEGFPTPNIEWYKNDQVIVDSDKFKFTNDGQVLEIANVFPEHEGIYKCKAFNDYTEITAYVSLRVVVSNTWLHVQITLVLCAVFFIAILTFMKFQKYKEIRKVLKLHGLFNSEKNNLHRINPNLSIEDQAALLPYNQKWEIPFENIVIGKQLGSGAFGVNFQATIVNHFPDDPFKTVVVKTVNPASGFECIKALVSELKILSNLGSHVNIVNFLGACTRRLVRDELYVVSEFCSFGNLLEYIKSHSQNFIDHKDYDADVFNWSADDAENSDNKTAVSSKNFLIWAFQITRGMEYLGSRRLIHGDLSAKNVLLTDENVVKICNFGLTKTVYNFGKFVQKFQAPLPIKWMALEAIQKRMFSTQSDVWSFGVVLWEIFSLGQTPYLGKTVDEHFCEKLIGGYRMEQPETATSKIYKLMLDCWQLDPLLRPSFTKLGEQIGSFLEDTVKNYYISMNNSYILKNKEQFGEDSDYLAIFNQPTYQNLISKGPEIRETQD